MQIIASDNKQVVVGLGATGLSCARYLASKHKKFSVVDSRTAPPGLDTFKTEFPDVPLFLGEISDEALQGADQLVVSPGVALTEPAIHRAMNSGIKVCGDIDLFRDEAQAPIVAITGSNGKSTVTTLLGEMAANAGLTVAVGGNLGVPALDLLAQSGTELYVLELSSFQLERAGSLNVEVATVLNVSADHMDRYPNLVAYHQAKHRIFRGCKQAVVNRNDPLSRPLVADDVVQWSFATNKPDFNGFGIIQEGGIDYLSFEFETLMPVSELKTVGQHNIENALAALALGKAIGLGFAPMLDTLRSFSGLPHRCQYVATVNQVRFYNDSKGTNVGAAIAAINGLQRVADQVVLIAGGESKDADFKPLLPVIKSKLRGLVVIGEAAPALQALAADHIPAELAESMQDAVALAAAMAQPDDAVLLSPACASFDMFDNYQHRGDRFVASVASLSDGRAS